MRGIGIGPRLCSQAVQTGAAGERDSAGFEGCRGTGIQDDVPAGISTSDGLRMAPGKDAPGNSTLYGGLQTTLFSDIHTDRNDVLQGPYLYTLLRDEKRFSPYTVAILYTTVYSAAALSAPISGYLADRFGRRAACLAFCAIHSLASLSVLFDALEILVLGRVAGGVGLTLLWSAFESWMVTEHKARGLDAPGSPVPLSAMFGIMTTANCITAILAGVLAHCVVLALGSKRDPFIFGLVLDAVAAVLMLRTWNENYGVQSSTSGATLSTAVEDDLMPEGTDIDATKDLRATESERSWLQGVVETLQDGRIWVLSFVSCCFEGTMFLFMFYWPGALQDAHAAQHPEDGLVSDGETSSSSVVAVPHGVIFANFMATMVIGALSFHFVMRSRYRSTAAAAAAAAVPYHPMTAPEDLDAAPSSPSERSTCIPAAMLAAALLVAGMSFAAAAALGRNELQLFCAFLALEACNGIYVPSIAYQRGQLVGDAGRASVYGLMNIPLFIFVIAALLTTSGNGAFFGLRGRTKAGPEFSELRTQDFELDDDIEEQDDDDNDNDDDDQDEAKAMVETGRE
ncbi:hypothetical protein BX600DRAFT_441995 [Xylariales sp. PMI_506]|nr:hypothetical protein BX600DRAFT_441995 [Xylariales sp. PMI_506]